MIKFFRKIRQRLIQENRFTKYLLYAVGEIVLVVIGILIALQINNWNEGRKRSNLEVETLKELRANLSSDINDFQSDMQFYMRTVESIDIIIEFIDGQIPYHDSLNVHLGKIPALGVFAPNKSAYDNLKITGIKLISNDTLRAALSDLYEGRYQYVNTYMQTEYQFDHQQFGKFYLKEMEEYDFLKFAKPIDGNRLVNNQEFRNLIMHRKLKIQGWFRKQYDLNIKKANEIIDMINKEIDS